MTKADRIIIGTRVNSIINLRARAIDSLRSQVKGVMTEHIKSMHGTYFNRVIYPVHFPNK